MVVDAESFDTGRHSGRPIEGKEGALAGSVGAGGLVKINGVLIERMQYRHLGCVGNVDFGNEDAGGLETGDGDSEIFKFHELVGEVEVDANVRTKPVRNETLKKFDDFVGGFDAKAGFGFEGENGAGGGGMFGAFQNIGSDGVHRDRFERTERDADGAGAKLCKDIEAGVCELNAGVRLVPRRQVNAFLDSLAVKVRHDEAVDRDQRKTLFGENFAELVNGTGGLLKLGDDALRETEFDGEVGVREDALFDARNVTGETGAEFGKRLSGEDVQGVADGAAGVSFWHVAWRNSMERRATSGAR